MTILTFYDHKAKESSFCKSKMIRDDAVQVLSSGGTLKLENINIILFNSKEILSFGNVKVDDWNISSQA